MWQNSYYVYCYSYCDVIVFAGRCLFKCHYTNEHSNLKKKIANDMFNIILKHVTNVDESSKFEIDSFCTSGT